MNYSAKKRQCEQRMIAFTFTPSQWSKLQDMKFKVKCAYTNAEFSHKESKEDYPSLERIDENLGYSPENCVWVTKKANQLKAHYIENGMDITKAEPHEQGYIRRIQRIIESVDNLDKIRQPYKHLYTPETKKEDNVTEVTTPEQTPKSNPELIVAKEFYNVCHTVECCKVEFAVTFSEFKTKLRRKRCEVTGRDIEYPKIFALMLSDQVTKANLIIMDKSVYEGLTEMITKSKLTHIEIQKMLRG